MGRRFTFNCPDEPLKRSQWLWWQHEAETATLRRPSRRICAQANERIQDTDTSLIGGDGLSGGFESVMPPPRESLPGGNVEAIHVEKDTSICQASPVASEAVPVEAAFDTTSSSNPEETPGCAEALPVQGSVNELLVRLIHNSSPSHSSIP